MTDPARDLQALAQRSMDADLQTLIRVKEAARTAMLQDKTAGNIAAFKAAQKALEAHVRKEQDQQSDPKPAGFNSLEEVRRFLNEQGYALSKSSIDRHKRQPGGPRPDADGRYSEAEAKRYAKAFDLKLKDTGLRGSESEALKRSGLVEAREELLREQTLLARRKREVEEGKYVLKSAVGHDLAARAVVIKTGLKQLAAAGVSEWIHLVEGNPKRAPELLRLVTEGFERLLSEYARAPSVVVLFNGSEEPTVEEAQVEEQASEQEAGNPVA